MKRVLTPIDTIGGVPIERIKLYCMNENGDVSEINSSIICNSIFIPKIFYCVQKDNKECIDLTDKNNESLKLIILKGCDEYLSYAKKKAPDYVYYYDDYGVIKYNVYFDIYMKSEKEFYNQWHNNYLKAEASWNEIINYLIWHEWPVNGIKSKNNLPVQRTETGRFAKGNKCAYYDTFPSNLVVALYRMKLPVAEMARLFEVSKNTIYSRIKQYDME